MTLAALPRLKPGPDVSKPAEAGSDASYAYVVEKPAVHVENANMTTREKIHIVINDETIAGGNTWAIIEPVCLAANLQEGQWLYEHSLRSFSAAQRQLVAVWWYLAEVLNGGHRQFYSNSTGVVWQDAIAGLEAIGVLEAAQILRQTAERLGGAPSPEREERQLQIADLQIDFKDCDYAFDKVRKKVDLRKKMLEFIQSRPSDFYFSGIIERIVREKRAT
jgi:hypothetical protein